MTKITVPMNGETGYSNGPRSNLQSRRIHDALKKAFPSAKITFSKGHYYCSAFIRFSDTNVVYMSISDYRFFPGQFLVRTAKDEKDYTGGSNNNGHGYENIIPMIKRVGRVA